MNECAYVGSDAFCSCVNLESIDISNCAKIESRAFYSCSKITNMSIPKCSYIGEDAFMHTRLNNLNLVNSLYMTALANVNALGNYIKSGTIYVHTKQYENYINDPIWSVFSSVIVSVNN
jgi:hypothetical protein